MIIQFLSALMFAVTYDPVTYFNQPASIVDYQGEDSAVVITQRYNVHSSDGTTDTMYVDFTYGDYDDLLFAIDLDQGPTTLTVSYSGGANERFNLMVLCSYTAYNSSDVRYQWYPYFAVWDMATGGYYPQNGNSTYNFNTNNIAYVDFEFTIYYYSEELFNNYVNGYPNGYTAGYNDGQNAGYDSGYTEGYIAGNQEGYSQGYQEASDQDSTAVTIFSGIVEVGLLPINVFLQFFNFEVFGINISALILSFMTIAITVIIIRMVTGKKND